MGLNVYLEAVGSVGYKAATATATGSITTIDGKPGKRLALTAVGFNDPGGVVAPVLYVMKALSQTTISAAVASGATTITTTAFATAPATSGNIVVVLDDGSYQWLTVASTASTTSVPISSALTDTVAAGNPVYFLNVYSTAGHFALRGTAAAQRAVALEPGIVYGSTKGSPLMLHLIGNASTALCQLDYASYGYINV
jgi:hypothetical protein